MYRICRHVSHKSSSKQDVAKEIYRKFATALSRAQIPDASAPIVTALELRSQRWRKTRGNAISSGINVVSEDLCNEALDLLAPSLEKHRGCNIIDFFPGPGLWSRKVHELLQPRAHVLVESGQDTYRSFLQPLLDQPGSRFRYTSLKSVFASDKNFYDDVVAALDSPGHRAKRNVDVPNTDVLVLANMTKLRLPKMKKVDAIAEQLHKADNSVSRTMSPAESFVFDFVRNLHTRTGPHAYGPARLLLWTLDRDKFHYLPKNIGARHPSALEIDEAFFVREIVGSARPPRSRRPAHMELQSAIQTAERMNFSGVSLPLARQSIIHRNVLKKTTFEPGRTDKDITSATKGLREILSELNGLELRWAFDGFQRSRRRKPDNDRRLTEPTDEYKRMTYLRAWLNNLVWGSRDADMKRIADSVHQAVTCQAALNKLERAVASGKCDSALVANPATLEQEHMFGPFNMEQLTERVDALSIRVGPARTTTWHRVSDDNEALVARPPLLAWDLRPFEPLEPQASEFYPQHKLALLDFEPRSIPAASLVSREPVLRIMRPLDHLPVSQMLDRVAHGAAAALLPQCPSINDPLRGGRLNLRNLRVRLLTHDMWREIVQAWARWPFRKSDALLMAELGRSSVFTDKDTEMPF